MNCLHTDKRYNIFFSTPPSDRDQDVPFISLKLFSAIFWIIKKLIAFSIYSSLVNISVRSLLSKWDWHQTAGLLKCQQKKSVLKNATIRNLCVCCKVLILISTQGEKHIGHFIICLSIHRLHHHPSREPVDICLKPEVMPAPSFFLRQWVESFRLALTSPSLLTQNYWSRPRPVNYNLLVKLLSPRFQTDWRARVRLWRR